MGSIGGFPPMGVGFGTLGAPNMAVQMDKSVAMDSEQANMMLAIAKTRRQDMDRRSHHGLQYYA